VLPEVRLARTASDHYRADFVNPENKVRWVTITQDFHAMGKTQLETIVASST
jgi:hypothetical protein